jgi:hypothetical protein
MIINAEPESVPLPGPATMNCKPLLMQVAVNLALKMLCRGSNNALTAGLLNAPLRFTAAYWATTAVWAGWL